MQKSYWGPPMSPSQYAVFHFDIETMSMRNAQGEYLSAEEPPLIFSTLDEARAYSTEKVAITPKLGCRIYNHRGETVESFSNPDVYNQHHGLPAAKRNLAIGAVCLATGFGAVALDASLKWRLMIGVVLGVRLVWAGCTKTIDGLAAWKDATSE